MKKLFLILAFSIFNSQFAYGAWTVVNQVCANQTGAGDGSDLVSSEVDTSGANLIVAYSTNYNEGAGASFADSRSNTWTGLTAQIEGNAASRFWYAYGGAGGGSHTFTLSNSGNLENGSFCVLALSGALSTDPIDQQSLNSNSGVTTVQPGSITPAQDNEIVVSGAAAIVQSFPLAVDSGFTIAAQTYNTGGQDAAIAYIIQTSAGAVNPTWTTGGDGPNLTAIVSFKVAATVAPVNKHKVIVLQ